MTGANLWPRAGELGAGALERNVPLLNSLLPSDSLAHWPVMDTEMDGHVTRTYTRTRTESRIVDRATFKPLEILPLAPSFPSRTKSFLSDERFWEKKRTDSMEMEQVSFEKRLLFFSLHMYIVARGNKLETICDIGSNSNKPSFSMSDRVYSVAAN